MKLKDILELGTYGFNPDCKVEIFNMDNFEERLENEGFDEILIPQNEDAKSILTLFDRRFYFDCNDRRNGGYE